jgi:transcription termination factor Rho
MRSDEAVERILDLFVRTKNNEEFVEVVKKTKLV